MTHRDFAPINGALLYFEDSGGTGEPLVFVHAGVADLRLWDAQAAHFSRQYRVIRYDLCGFGQSQPVDREFTYRDDLYQLLQYLGVDQAHLVGCSMGGGMCMDVTLEHPEMVASLTMVCSGAAGLDAILEVPSAPDLDAKFQAAEAAFNADDLDLVTELETQIWFDGRGRTAADVDPMARQLVWAMNRQALVYEKQGLGKRKPPLTPSAGERLQELQLPVCIIVGLLDTPFVLAAADYMAQQIVGAQKFTLANTAHLPSLERPTEFNAILAQFLTGIKSL